MFYAVSCFRLFWDICGQPGIAPSFDFAEAYGWVLMRSEGVCFCPSCVRREGFRLSEMNLTFSGK